MWLYSQNFRFITHEIYFYTSDTFRPILVPSTHFALAISILPPEILLSSLMILLIGESSESNLYF